MDVQARVQGGVCGLETVIVANSDDGMNVRLRIESDCPKVQELAGELPEIDAFEQILRKPFVETTPALLAAKHKLHVSCLVPVSIVKAVEVAAGLALPVTCEVSLTRLD